MERNIGLRNIFRGLSRNRKERTYIESLRESPPRWQPERHCVRIGTFSEGEMVRAIIRNRKRDSNTIEGKVVRKSMSGKKNPQLSVILRSEESPLAYHDKGSYVSLGSGTAAYPLK